jgi:hypothetical protein
MVLACRSEARGKEAEARLKGGIPEVSKAHFVRLDLTARPAYRTSAALMLPDTRRRSPSMTDAGAFMPRALLGDEGFSRTAAAVDRLARGEP